MKKRKIIFYLFINFEVNNKSNIEKIQDLEDLIINLEDDLE
jgi:hypothetical protein